MIYIIDNDLSVRKALERLITSADLKARAFSSSEQIMSTVPPADIRCLIVDDYTPGITITELKQHLSQAGIDAPLIFITRDDNESARAQARQIGAAGFFLKPVDGQALLDTIRFVLN